MVTKLDDRTLDEQIFYRIEPKMRDAALKIERRLLAAGFEAYIVGGCVRDLILGKKTKDVDFTTSATPQQVIALFHKTVPVGIDFGTVLVLEGGYSFEVTTFRLETDYADGRHPTSVNFGKELKEDVLRRDFTINGMAYSLTQKKLFDFIAGLSDLRLKIIRTIGSPLERFGEDGLRPIRGCRFAANLEFEIEESTALAMRLANATTALVARERFYDEWRKTSQSLDIYRFWKLLYENKIFEIFLKDLPLLCAQFLQHDVFQDFFNTRWSSMSGYIAKMLSAEMYLFNFPKEKNEYCFERLPAFENFNRHHKFPLKVYQQALRLATSPFFTLFRESIHGREYSIFLLKQCLNKIPPQEVIKHFKYFKLCCRKLYRVELNFDTILSDVLQVFKKKEPIYLKQLAINGNDILSFKISGKQVGICLQGALELVMKNPSYNTKEILLKEIQKKMLPK